VNFKSKTKLCIQNEMSSCDAILMQSFHSFQTLNIFKFLIFFLKRKKKIPVSSCRTTTSRQQKYLKKRCFVASIERNWNWAVSGHILLIFSWETDWKFESGPVS
jgi:hypothetical protein